MEFKTGIKYFAHHIHCDEDWVILGINIEKDKVCAAGWPPSIAKLSDCIDFEEAGPLTEKEIEYRKKQFGNDWL